MRGGRPGSGGSGSSSVDRRSEDENGPLYQSPILNGGGRTDRGLRLGPVLECAARTQLSVTELLPEIKKSKLIIMQVYIQIYKCMTV